MTNTFWIAAKIIFDLGTGAKVPFGGELQCTGDPLQIPVGSAAGARVAHREHRIQVFARFQGLSSGETRRMAIVWC